MQRARFYIIRTALFGRQLNHDRGGGAVVMGAKVSGAEECNSKEKEGFGRMRFPSVIAGIGAKTNIFFYFYGLVLSCDFLPHIMYIIYHVPGQSPLRSLPRLALV